MINRQVQNMLLRNAMLRRSFSTVATASDNQAAPKLFKSLWETSEEHMIEEAEKAAQQADYLQKLKQENNERGAYKPFEAAADDVPAISKIKNRINHIVEKELVLADFKGQVDKEALQGETYNEVITRKNFYFEVDENKQKNNLAVHNMNAPGNIYRKPKVILPHEHITQTGFMDVTGFTEEKEWELFGYYAYMVDLHIAQIRPDNLEAKSYIPKRFNQVEFTKTFDSHLNNRFFEYYHRWREPTRTWFSQTQELDFQEQLKNRPTTSHYDHDRGSKYDVEWNDE